MNKKQSQITSQFVDELGDLGSERFANNMIAAKRKLESIDNAIEAVLEKKDKIEGQDHWIGDIRMLFVAIEDLREAYR